MSSDSNSTLSVRMFYQSASAVPCCIHLVLPLTRSSKHCHAAVINVHSSTAEYEPQRLCNSLTQQNAEYSCFGSLTLTLLSSVAYLLNCVFYYLFLWLFDGELLANMSIAISSSVACPHVFVNNSASPSLHRLGSPVRNPGLPRHRNGGPPFRSSTPVGMPGLLQFTLYTVSSYLPLQTLASCSMCDARFPHRPHYDAIIFFMHQSSSFLFAIKHIPTRRLWLRVSRRSLTASREGVLSGFTTRF